MVTVPQTADPLASIKGGQALSKESASGSCSPMLPFGSQNLTAENTSPYPAFFPPLLIASSPSDQAMDTVKAKRRYRRLQEMKRLFRCVEALAALLLLGWSFVHLRTATRLSGDLIRRLAALFVSPRFVFVLGNAIVLVLFAKSGHSPPSPAAASTPAADGEICDEFVERRRRMVQCSEAEVEYQDKNVCAEGRACRRSRSERLERGRTAQELRRTVTEVEGSCQNPPAASEEDAEEFRRTIEAFIAKQLRFRRQESMMSTAIVFSAGTLERDQ